MRCKDGKNLNQEIQKILTKRKLKSIHSWSKLEIIILILAIPVFLYLAVPIFSASKNSKKTISSTKSKTVRASEIYSLRAPSVVLIQLANSLGSGVIVENNGKLRVLTNAHVVSEETSVEVFLKDNRKYIAQVLNCDTVSDLAVITFPKNIKDIAAVPLGDPKNIKIGQDVLVIGHPRGYQWSLTRGTVSAVRDDYTIQTDADINPGNSGGPLLNEQGEMIGITTFTVGKNNAIGFAVSINRIKEFLQIVGKN